MLSGLQGGLRNAVKKLVGGGTVDEAAVKEFVKDLQRSLLQADVNVQLVLALSTKIEQRALDEKLPPGLPRKDHIVKILYEELSRILGEETEFKLPQDKTSIILLAGIQGSGKTTITAKLALKIARKTGMANKMQNIVKKCPILWFRFWNKW